MGTLSAQRSLHVRWIQSHVLTLDALPFLLWVGWWGGGVEARVLCMLGKPSIPELHHEFLRALAFSGACLPSCVRKHGMGECLGLGSHEV